VYMTETFLLTNVNKWNLIAKYYQKYIFVIYIPVIKMCYFPYLFQLTLCEEYSTFVESRHYFSTFSVQGYLLSKANNRSLLACTEGNFRPCL